MVAGRIVSEGCRTPFLYLLMVASRKRGSHGRHSLSMGRHVMGQHSLHKARADSAYVGVLLSLLLCGERVFVLFILAQAAVQITRHGDEEVSLDFLQLEAVDRNITKANNNKKLLRIAPGYLQIKQILKERKKIRK